jgi:hypothetical protein
MPEETPTTEALLARAAAGNGAAWGDQQAGSGAPATSAASAVPEASGAVFALVAFAGANLSARRRDRTSSFLPRLRPPKMQGLTSKFDE